MVIKKDRKKLLSGIMKAFEKRPIGIDRMEEIVTQIERSIQKKSDREVSSARIGELVMERLRMMDDVAYVRFASVYRQFKDVGQFMDELKGILHKETRRKRR
jgi:transcriptional repressor NrdR